MAKQELSQDSPMTKEELEEFEQFKAWKKSQAESSNRSSSPPKKQKTEEDSQSITDIDPEFAGALQGLGVFILNWTLRCGSTSDTASRPERTS